mmetsp:Transcript_13485/g.35878  ORF Transcript_13485/g.35878 Transcript_13485/m.35878 type:complete len:221 (-) Transcript_13485:1013-1675(-)
MAACKWRICSALPFWTTCTASLRPPTQPFTVATSSRARADWPASTANSRSSWMSRTEEAVCSIFLSSFAFSRSWDRHSTADCLSARETPGTSWYVANADRKHTAIVCCKPNRSSTRNTGSASGFRGTKAMSSSCFIGEEGRSASSDNHGWSNASLVVKRCAGSGTINLATRSLASEETPRNAAVSTLTRLLADERSNSGNLATNVTLTTAPRDQASTATP